MSLRRQNDLWFIQLKLASCLTNTEKLWYRGALELVRGIDSGGAVVNLMKDHPINACNVRVVLSWWCFIYEQQECREMFPTSLQTLTNHPTFTLSNKPLCLPCLPCYRHINSACHFTITQAFLASITQTLLHHHHTQTLPHHFTQPSIQHKTSSPHYHTNIASASSHKTLLPNNHTKHCFSSCLITLKQTTFT